MYMGLQLIQLIREAAANFPDTSLIVTPRIDQSGQTSLIYSPDPTMTRGINWLQSHHYRHLEYSQEIESVLSLLSQ